MLLDEDIADLVAMAVIEDGCEYAHILLRLIDLTHQLQADLIEHGQRPHGHADLLAKVVNQEWVDTFEQQFAAFVEEAAEGPRREKAQRVVHHDGGLANLPGEIERLGQGLLAGLLTADNFHQRHLLDGREEMDTNEVARALGGLGQQRDWQRRRVGTEHSQLSQVLFCQLSDLALELDTLEHRLDNEIRTLQIGVIRGRLDKAKDLRLFIVAQAALGNRLAKQLVDTRLAFLCRLQTDVEQHDLDTGLGRHMSDAITHHAGTQNAELAHLALLETLGTAGAAIHFVQLEEHGVDDVLRLDTGGEVSQSARLHHQRCIEVQQSGLNGHGQNALWSRQQTAGVLGRHGHGASDHGRDVGLLGCSAGDLMAFAVPGLNPELLALSLSQDPRLGGRH
ncbi:hypothetical protein D9M68_619540 [compost metagenome]